MIHVFVAWPPCLRPTMWASEVPHLRGAATLAVIAVHTIVGYRSFQPVDHTVAAFTTLDVLLHFAVPLFVFASGLVLAMRYPGPVPSAKFYRRRAAVLIPPYLIFSTFYLAYEWQATGTPPSAVRVAYDYATGGAYYHLWFIALILQLYFLYPVAVRIHARYLRKLSAWHIIAASVAIQTAYNVATLAYGPIADSGLAASLARRLFVGHLAYFVVGIYVGRNLDAVRARLAQTHSLSAPTVGLAVTGAVSAIWVANNALFGGYYEIPPENLLWTAVLTPILYFSTIVLLLKWSVTARNRVVRRFGEYSLWVYLVHPILMVPMVLAFTWFGIGSNPWLFFPTVFASTCLLCLLSTFLLDRIPHNTILGGPRRTGGRIGTIANPAQEHP